MEYWLSKIRREGELWLEASEIDKEKKAKLIFGKFEEDGKGGLETQLLSDIFSQSFFKFHIFFLPNSILQIIPNPNFSP